MKNPFEVLGVPETADDKEIKKAYRKLAAEHHPDRGGDAEKFKEVAEAYSTISDQQKRQQFHASSRGFDFQGFNFGGGFDPFSAFGDIFNFNSRPPRRQVNKDTQDSDIQFNLRINLEQIKRGSEQQITFKRNRICQDCNGAGGEGGYQCGVCHGSGVNVQKLNNHFVHQATCAYCQGRGFKFKEKCRTCNTNGYVQVQDRVVIKIEESKEKGEE